MTTAINLRDVTAHNLAPIGASATNVVIAEFSNLSEAALNFRADIVCSDVTVADEITAKLQHKALGSDTYVDLTSANSSTTITTDGVFSILMHVQRAADLGDLPLRKSMRIVVNTGVGDAVTITTVSVQQ